MNIDQGNGFIEVQGIKCYFPPAPEKQNIINYGLPTKKQKWARTELPTFTAKDVEIWSNDEFKADDVITWEEAVRQEHIKIFGTDPYDLDKQGNERDVPGIDVDMEYSMECLEGFRAQELDRVYNGVWIYIKGKLFYLPGCYYLYLNYWQLKDGYAEFRYIDLELFWVWEAVRKSKNFLGLIYITLRGAGKSYIAGCIQYYETITHRKANTTVQSKSDDDAGIFFREKVLLPITQLPEFLIPIHKHPGDITSLNAIEFVPKARKGMSMRHFLEMKKRALYSKSQYHNAGEFAADGGTWDLIVQEEIGKCLKKGTPILMFDGSIKKVEDVVKGDQLMGPDSKPRNVLGISRGQEMMYDVIPNKKDWLKWGCNESHILSLKSCSSNIGGGFKKNGIYNISVEEYLKLTKTQKKHLMLYKVSVEYPESYHYVDPYFLGLWLGDGNSKALRIYNIDPEIDEYLKEFAKRKRIPFKKKDEGKNGRTCWTYTFAENGLRNTSSKWLSSLGLLNGKKIPKEFMIDSSENRLKLLAGLIDTDGNFNKCAGKSMNYEITQKSKLLATQIQDLCVSLGFGATLNEKNVKFRGKNLLYHRVTISGDLYKIPVLIARKKAPKLEYTYRKSSNNSSFELIQKGVGDYYGFSLDGDKLFLLADHQVTHNTDPAVADVYKRMGVIKFTVLRVNKKLGNIFASSTVEEMDEGGAECHKIWQESNQYEIGDTNTTNTGLVRFFRSAIDATMFDEYGFSVGYEPEDKETKKYIIAKYGEVFGKNAEFGAKAVHDAKRKALKHDTKSLVAYIQKNPYNEKEAFWINADDCIYNAQILMEAKERILDSDRKYVRKGDIVWEEKDKKAKWVDNDKNGKWEVSFFDFDQNQVQLNDFGGKTTFTPKASHKRVMAFDPYSNRDLVREDRGSNAAAVVYNKPDYHIPDEYCDTIIADYLYRHDDPFDSYEDIICACFFFGCEVLIEKNKSNALDYFRQRGYMWGYDNNPSDFIMSRPESTLTQFGNKISDGITSSDPMIEHYTNSTARHIEKHGHKLKHLRPIDDWLVFRPQKTQLYDMAVAASYAIVAAEKRVQEQAKVVDISSIFKTYDNSGKQSKVNYK